MNITHIDYFELPAPLEISRAVLLDPATWALLPTTAEHPGEMWRMGDELYTVTCRLGEPDGDSAPPAPSSYPRHDQRPGACYTIQWEAVPVAAVGARLHIEMTLYDAAIATHARVRVSLVRGDIWPWQRLLMHLRLVNTMRQCKEALQAVLRRATLPRTSDNGAASVSRLQPAHMPGTAAGRDNGSDPTRADADLPDQLRRHYPQTVQHFEAMGALDHLERVWWLERNWERILRGEYSTAVHEERPASGSRKRPPQTLDFDLIYAGGGLGLLHAVAMAQCYGWRVMLFDRSEVGCVHREWNISRAELQALVDMGLVTWEELETVIMRDYRMGVVNFHTGPASKVPDSELWFPDVLNTAIDAGGLLQLMRRKLEQAGGTILDRRNFTCVRSVDTRPPHVEVVLQDMQSGSEEVYSARLLLDGMGSTSPLALRRHAGEPFAGVCPTVGTVVAGLEPGSTPHQHDPTIGDILISVADTQDGKQMIWEGFPGRDDELTVYVFYYAALREAGRRARKPLPEPRIPSQPAYSLLELFEQYFAMLPSYKRPGPDFRHVKPVYGYIPGRHSLQSQEAPLLRGVLPTGDSAAQQSPLTYCGFGSHVRNLPRTSSLLDYALRHALLEPHHLRHINAFQSNVSLNWIFSRFMQPWLNKPQGVNELQNAFLGALNELGGDLSSRFFRDRMHWHDYNRVVWRTMLRYNDVFLIAWPVLGVAGVWQWFTDYARFSLASASAAVGRVPGISGERLLCQVAGRISPALSLSIRARYAEWRAMGWLEPAPISVARSAPPAVSVPEQSTSGEVSL